MCPQQKLQEQDERYKTFDELKRELRSKEGKEPLRFYQMSDEKLLETMETYGCSVVDWKRKFAGGLPEVDKRGLWAKEGFNSILHYASVKAAFSHELTKKILRISRKIYPFGGIRKLFEEGEVGWPKLEEVAGLITKENEHVWLERLQTMSTRAIRQVAQYIRYLNNPEKHDGNDHSEPSAKSKTGSGSEQKARPRPGGKPDKTETADNKPNPGDNTDSSPGGNTDSESKTDDDIGDESISNSNTDVDGKQNNSESAKEKVITGTNAYRKSKNRQASTDAFIASLVANGLEETYRGRKTVSIKLDPLVAQRLLHIQEGLKKKYQTASKKSPNLSETIDFVLTHFDETANSIPAYEEVIFRNAATGNLTTKTSWGPVVVVEEDLEERKQKYPPIDLDEDRLVAKEAAAAYEAKCKAKGKRVGRKIPKAVRDFVRRREGGFCCCPGCNKKGKRYHHIKPFNKYRSHDPDGIVLFCVSCHKLLHEGVFWLEELKAKMKVALGAEVTSPTLYKVLFRKDTKVRSKSQSEMEKTNRKYQEHKKRAFKGSKPEYNQRKAKRGSAPQDNETRTNETPTPANETRTNETPTPAKYDSN